MGVAFATAKLALGNFCVLATTKQFSVRVGRCICLSIKQESPELLSKLRAHNTGNDLLSHRIVAVLPSAAEGLTSVFGMGTCVSPRL